jgi:hypothetical protein
MLRRCRAVAPYRHGVRPRATGLNPGITDFRCGSGLPRRAGEVIRHRIFLDSSAVEQSTVNRLVVGSNPTRGATFPHRPPTVRFGRTQLPRAFLIH